MPDAPPAERFATLSPARERALLFTLAGIQFCHIVDFMVMMPLGPVLLAELAIGAGEFGLLVSAYTLTAAVAGLLVAAFIDRFERKRLLLVTFALFALATLACGLAPGFASLLVARCAAGAFGGVLGAMVHTMVGDLIPFSRRGRASGTIMAAFSISTVAGVPLSLLLANQFGWRAPFVFIAALSALFLAIGWLRLPEMRGHLPEAEDAVGTRAHPLAAMAEVLGDANCRRALIFMALVIASGFTVIPYITLYLVNNVGVALDQVPLIYLCGGIASFFSARWIGRLADRHGKVRVYRFVAFAALVPLLVLTNLPPVPLLPVLLCTTAFFVLMPGRMVPAMAIITSAVRPQLRGTFMSLNASTLQLASGAAAFAGGLIVTADASGGLHHYEVAGLVAVAATLLAIRAVNGIRLDTSGGDRN
jgi:predicted MFS family arabinose efflux permease